MAKRKRLTPPSDARLNRIGASLEGGSARPTAGPLAPIAAVAADAAAQSVMEDPTTRADAERYRKALAQGMVVEAIALDQIAADDILRDRTVVDADEMAELKASISAHGLRMPVEVYAISEPNKGFSYGLISGWRRLTALRELLAETGDQARFGTINALIRQPETSAEAYVAMVEENEIRADISQYERGRIAVLAAEQGAFEDVNAAVNALFAAGSKAKRSKIRSFALLHEALGDALRFPAALSERQGLQLAGLIKAGKRDVLRKTLIRNATRDAAQEWTMLEAAVAETQPAQNTPKTPKAPLQKLSRQSMPQGTSVIHERAGDTHVLRLEGAGVNDAFVQELLAHIRAKLG